MTKRGRVIRTHTEVLPVRLSPDELRARGEKLAGLEGELASTKVKNKIAKDQMKLAESELEADIARIALHIRDKAEPRHVEVEVMHSDTRKNWVEEVRTDTGEVVRERSIREEERQEDLLPPGDA